MWGVIRYGHRKTYPTSGRSTALEAGSVMHEVFALCRLNNLLRFQKLPKHFDYHGKRLFTPDRWKLIKKEFNKPDHYDALLSAAFTCLHTSAWYDDADDRSRSMAEFERSTIRYVGEYLDISERWPIWVADKKDHTAPVGVEYTGDITIYFPDREPIRVCGTLDGLYDKDNELYLGENKTGIRLDDGWRESFKMRHQVTLYSIIGMTCLNRRIEQVKVFGLKTKQTGHQDDYISFLEPRRAHSYSPCIDWIRHSVETYEKYSDNFEAAPRFTHSCNRYFRPCALITFCADDPEGRQDQFAQMVETPLSPTEMSVRWDR